MTEYAAAGNGLSDGRWLQVSDSSDEARETDITELKKGLREQLHRPVCTGSGPDYGFMKP